MAILYKIESFEIMGAAYEVHSVLGNGFTEYVYQDALELEFQKREIPYEREKKLKVTYKGTELKHEYIADFVCYGEIVVELKAIKELCEENKSQVINYLKATEHKLGILLNFGASSLESQRLIRL